MNFDILNGLFLIVIGSLLFWKSEKIAKSKLLENIVLLETYVPLFPLMLKIIAVTLFLGGVFIIYQNIY